MESESRKREDTTGNAAMYCVAAERERDVENDKVSQELNEGVPGTQ